jgi:DNA-binding transcriptional regulator LsrR (DeoR family)
MGIAWEDLCQIGLTIGIAAGKQKAQAILGAARSHRLHTLVIDDVAAELMLYLKQQGP